MSKTNTMMKRVPHWEVRQFGDSAKPAKYAGTWKWSAGYIGGMSFMPIFTVMKSSHGYRKGCFKKGRTISYKGSIIKTKTEALRQAKAATPKK